MSTPSKIPYVRLGQSGLKVSKVILGCMSYGDVSWQAWVLDEEASLEHFKAAYDLGINTWDTADVYSNGVSEQIVGEAIRKYNLPRDNLVILTKVFNPVPHLPGEKYADRAAYEAAGYVNQQGLSRKHILASVDRSLERLGLDYIDLLQCHRFDPDTPIAETMQALHDVVQSGKVRYIGMSSCWAYQFAAMQSYAREHRLTEFISMQDYYSAAYREEEREMIPYCRSTGVGVIPWSPLSRGFLTRPVGETTRRVESDPGFKGRKYDAPPAALAAVNQAVETIAKAKNVSMAQVALAWVLAQPGVTAPIIGSTSLAHLAELAASVHLDLTADEVASISGPYAPQAVTGHV